MKIDIRSLPVYWINSSDSIDRAKRMTETLDRLGFINHKRVDAIINPNKVIGCALSHAKYIDNLDDNMFILMEDDILETEYFNPIIDIPDDFDAFYLGTSYWPNDINRARASLMSNSTQKIKITEDIYQISYMTALHAVIYRTSSYKETCCNAILDYLQNPKGNQHCDVAVAEIQKDFKVYAPSYPLFYQSDVNNRANEAWTIKPLKEFE